MVASRQVEIPYYRAVGRQRGWGSGAVAQVIGGTAIPLLCKYVVPAANLISADKLEIAAPEFGEVNCGRKSFKSAAKSVRMQILKKQLGEGSRRQQGGNKQMRIIPPTTTKPSSRSRRDIFTNISRRSCQTTIFGSNLLWRCLETFEGKVSTVDDVLSSHEQETYPTTSLDENCIEFEFQTDRNYYVHLRQSFLALKLKFVKGRGYETYESKGKKTKHIYESVVFSEKGSDEEEQEEVARVTYVNNIMHSIFPNVKVYIKKQQVYNSTGLYAHLHFKQL